MLWSDIRHSIRGLTRMPGFTFICMLTLALGIGATTSIFSAIYHTMLRPLPFEGGDRLGYVWAQDSAAGISISPPTAWVDAWRKARLHSFDDIEYYSSREVTLLGGAEPELIKSASISQNLPTMLHVEPVLGRTFTDEEMQPNSRNVVMLSEGLWKRRFGGARNALGKQVQLSDGKRYEIVGVMPNVFGSFERNLREGQIWFPLRREPVAEKTFALDASLIALLKKDVTPEMAAKELGGIASAVKVDFGMPGKWAPQLMTANQLMDPSTSSGLKVLFAAVGFVLLIGCANIAGLLLVRLNARRREIAIRSAVGARRFTIMRLLLVESLIIAIGGGALGLVLASWITSGIHTIRPDSLNTLDSVATDATALAFAFIVSLVTAIIFGIAPIISAMRRDVTGDLVGTAGTRVTSGNRARSILVGGQIALSLILLVASLLLVRSVRTMQSKDLGFDPNDVATFGVQLRESGTDATNKAFFDQLLASLRKLPGVTSVSLTTSVPSKGGVMFGEVTVPGRELTAAQKPKMLAFTGSTPEYAKTIGLRLREGRFFTDHEAGDPVVINETWAKKVWPGESAVGKQLHIGRGDGNLTVVGVVADVSSMGATALGDQPHIYVPYTYSYPHATIAMKTDGRSAASLFPQARRLLQNADPTLVARDEATLNDLMADTISLDRFYMQLLSSFAVLALVLSAVGLYGVISNSVAQRTREIGVRMALGATPHDVQRMVFRQSLKIVVVGLLVGSVAALDLVRYMKATLHGFSAYDPFSFAVAAVVLSAGAVLATYLPARRAVRVDPLDALRAE
jgi:putative ABC transport system permease protein